MLYYAVVPLFGRRFYHMDSGGWDILIDVLKLSDNLAKPHVRLADTSGLDPSREHGLLPPSNIIGASTPANSLVGHVGF